MSVLTRHSALSHSILREHRIDAERMLRLTGVDRLSQLVPSDFSLNVILAELPKVLAWMRGSGSPLPRPVAAAIQAEMRTGVVERKRLWVAEVQADAVPAIQGFFGEDPTGDPLVHVISDSPGEQSESGELLVVVAINHAHWCQAWANGTPNQQAFVKEAMRGVDSSVISNRAYHALKKLGAEIIPSTWAYRGLRNPKFWAYVIVFIYSCLRALPVVFVKNFEGSVFVLWAMDVLTAIPYTWGLISFVAGRTRRIRYLGLAVALITFVSPYVYFWTHGRGYPAGVNVVVACMILGALGWEAFNYMRDRAIRSSLYRSPRA